MKKMVLKTVIGILLACSLFVGFLYISSDIGIASGNLETGIRSSQKIKEDWAVDGSVSDTMAAYISYPQDMSDHTFPSMSIARDFPSDISSARAENSRRSRKELQSSPQRVLMSAH